MRFTKIPSIAARLDNARDTFLHAKSGDEATVEAAYRKTRNELMLAGLRDLAGHDGVEIQPLPVKKFEPEPFLITLVPPTEGAPRPSFSDELAGFLNTCRDEPWPDQFTEEVKPSDTQCIRSELFIRSVLEETALVLRNPSPNEVLDPITTDDMRAFAIPGGLLSALDPDARDSVQPQP
jgi:hypothetical protein